ncbi:MAG: hypothetical protein KDC95_16690 [Planctomycetes bacterium]|nr:hypothetical protein [Planctomycetota bacterium]
MHLRLKNSRDPLTPCVTAIAITFAIHAQCTVSAQNQWKPLVAARTTTTSIWAVSDTARYRVLSLDQTQVGLQLSIVDANRTPVPTTIPSPLLAKGIAGGTNSGLIVVARDTTGEDVTFQWNGYAWSQSRQRASAMRIPVGNRLIGTQYWLPSRLFVNLATAKIELDEFDALRLSWTTRTTTNAPATTSEVAAAASKNHDILLFDGERGETWLLSGTQWTKQNGTSPGPRVGAAMAYDLFRDRFVLHGGRVEQNGQVVTLDETWEWDGVWQLRTKGSDPLDRRHGHSLVYSIALGNRCLAVGGAVSSGPTTGVTIAPRDDVRDYGVIYTPVAKSFGSSCSTYRSGLDASLPWVGDSVDVRWGQLEPIEDAGLVLTGFSRTQWGSLALPLDLSALGNAGCRLYCSPDLLLVVPRYTQSIRYTLPAQKSILGATYFHQVASLFAGKWSWSSALELQIGGK